MRVIGIVVAMAGALLLEGCVVSQNVYVQDSNVSGPINHPPVYLTLDSSVNQIRLSPWVSLNSTKRAAGKISNPTYLNGGKPYDLKWDLPDFTFGLGMDLGMSQSASLVVGGDYSAIGPSGVWGGYLGLGLRSAGPSTGMRFDAGILLTGMHHDSYSMVVTNTQSIFGGSSDTGYYHDRGRNIAFDFYAMLTLNSRFKDSPVNIFINACVLRQSLMDYSPNTWSEVQPFVPFVNSNEDAEYTETVVSITPGVSFQASGNMRFILGWRFDLLTSSDLSPSNLGYPMFQVDYIL